MIENDSVVPDAVPGITEVVMESSIEDDSIVPEAVPEITEVVMESSTVVSSIIEWDMMNCVVRTSVIDAEFSIVFELVKYI